MPGIDRGLGLGQTRPFFQTRPRSNSGLGVRSIPGRCKENLLPSFARLLFQLELGCALAMTMSHETESTY